MSYQYNYVPPAQPEPAPPPDKRKRNITLGIAGGVLVILLCCCAIAAIVLVVDPFGWNLLSRLRGNYDAVAVAAPADTSMYMGINLLNATPQKLDPLISAFKDAYKDATGEDVSTSEDMMDEIDKSLEEFDMTLEEDVVPWIGQYAGVGLLDLNMDAYGYSDTPDIFLAIEARSKTNADEFLVKLSEEIADAWDVDVETTEYQDATIYFVDEEWNQIAFGRSGNLVILANSEDSIRQVVDAQKGDAIADDAAYRNLIGELPSDRLATIYIPASAMADLTETLDYLYYYAGGSIDELYTDITGMALSISVADPGLRIDSVAAYNTGELSEVQRQMLEASGRANNLADMLPGETFAYFTGNRLDLVWSAYYETLSELTEGDIDEAMSELEDEVGFDPNSDLLPYLDGAYGMGVFTDNEGVFAEYSDINLGVLMAFETSNEDALRTTLDSFTDFMQDMDAEIDETTAGDMTIFAITSPYDDQMFAYGLGGGWLGLSTSPTILENMQNPETSLADDALFRDALGELDGGMNVAVFVNVTEGIDVIRDSISDYDRDDFDEVADMLSPIEYLVLGSTSLSGDVVHSAVFISIPTEP